MIRRRWTPFEQLLKKSHLLLFAYLCAFPTPVCADEIYRSGPELVSQLTVVNRADHYEITEVLNVCVQPAEGKTADVRGQAEVTSTFDFNVGVGYFIEVVDYDSVNKNKVISRHNLTPARNDKYHTRYV
jgi:hypothetical protein